MPWKIVERKIGRAGSVKQRTARQGDWDQKYGDDNWQVGYVAIYQERAFDRMPILSDALEETACTNFDILNHCRKPGEHVKGCWALDLVLGKE